MTRNIIGALTALALMTGACPELAERAVHAETLTQWHERTTRQRAHECFFHRTYEECLVPAHRPKKDITYVSPSSSSLRDEVEELQDRVDQLEGRR